MDPKELDVELRSLIKDCIIPEKRRDANSVIWQFASLVVRRNRAEVNSEVKKVKAVYEAKEQAVEQKRAVADSMSDEEKLSKFLDNLMQRGADNEFDAALAGKIIELHGLRAKDREICIEVVDFSKAYPEEAKAVEVAAEMIRMKIEEANL
jgi:hypothetical protein